MKNSKRNQHHNLAPKELKLIRKKEVNYKLAFISFIALWVVSIALIISSN